MESDTTKKKHGGDGLLVTDARATADKAWRRLTRHEWAIVAIATAVLIITTLPRLAPGACFGDPGDVQVACATRGIMHPPGYAGYAAVGWLICKALPMMDAAYVVNLVCYTSVVVSLLLVCILLIRLGLHALMAAPLALSLALFPHVWSSITVPEIYGPSLVLLTTSIYLMVRYERLGRRRDLYLAAFVFGFLSINRIPAIMYTPGFVAALGAIEYRRARRGAALVKPAITAAVVALIPMLVTVGLFIQRDVPSTPYNYITNFQKAVGTIPEASEDLATRWERVHWEITGQQFAGTFGSTYKQAASRILWFRQQFALEEPLAFALALVLLVLGIVRLSTRSIAAGLIASWVVASVVVYLLVYRIFGQAADLLPLLVGVAIIFGGALSGIAPADTRRGALAMWLLFVGVCGYVGYRASVRPSDVEKYDGRRIIEEIDLADVPSGATIIAEFDVLGPLWYARCVLTPRVDVDLVMVRQCDPIPKWLEEKGTPVLAVYALLEDGTQRSHHKKVDPKRIHWTLRPYDQATWQEALGTIGTVPSDKVSGDR